MGKSFRRVGGDRVGVSYLRTQNDLQKVRPDRTQLEQPNVLFESKRFFQFLPTAERCFLFTNMSVCFLFVYLFFIVNP